LSLQVTTNPGHPQGNNLIHPERNRGLCKLDVIHFSSNRYTNLYYKLTALVTHIRLIIGHVSSKDSSHLQRVPLHKVWAYIVQTRQNKNLIYQLFPNVFACGPLLASINNYVSSHPCQRKYTVSGRYASKIKNLHLRTDFRYLRIHTSIIHNNALQYLTLGN